MLIHRALKTSFIDYVKTFKIKTGVEHYKLSFETINIKIGLFFGSSGAKNCSKKDQNFINVNSQGSVDFVY